MLATYREFQREHHDTLIQPVSDGVEDMLRALKADGHRLGVVTSKMEGFARRGLRLFGLERLLRGRRVSRRHRAAQAGSGAAPLRGRARGRRPSSDVIYVGDSTHDIVAGRAAGMRTLRCCGARSSAELLERVKPDSPIATPAELPPLVEIAPA